MIEYEVKFKHDTSLICEIIKDLFYIGEKQQTDIYYDTCNRSLFLKAVFFRKRNGKRIDLKYNFDLDTSHLFCTENNFELPLTEEQYMSLDSFLSKLLIPTKETYNNIFDKFGLDEFVIINKKRKTYQGKDFNVYLDQVNNLGEFIEIEAINENGIIYINEFLQKNSIQRITTGYVELYLKKYDYNLYQKGKYLTI